jgi:hypothetical protein
MKSVVDPDEDERARQTLYIRSHGDVRPGEQTRRNYDWSHANPSSFRFGVAKHVRNDGHYVKQSMTWRDTTTTTNNPNASSLITVEQDKFLRRTTHQVGQAMQPNAGVPL